MVGGALCPLRVPRSREGKRESSLFLSCIKGRPGVASGWALGYHDHDRQEYQPPKVLRRGVSVDTQAVAKILDEVIAETGDEEFKRLSQGMESSEWAPKVGNALSELRKLSQGVMPQYDDEWVALFYLLWFQPKQIALAYSIIKKMFEADSLAPNGKKELHVIDFGCGTLAMQFAIALAAANATEQGLRGIPIHVDSIDSSHAMINLGGKCWDKFQQRISKNRTFGELALALSFMTTSTYNNANSIVKRNADCWLSAIHAVYDSTHYSNIVDVKQVLYDLYDKHSPIAGFVSSHAANWQLVRIVFPFEHGLQSDITNAFTSGELPEVTQLRRSFRAKILRDFVPSGSVDIGLISSYLSNAATWEWPTATVMVYPEW